MGDEVGLERVAGAWLARAADQRLDNLAAVGVGFTDHGTFGDGGVGDEAILDSAGPMRKPLDLMRSSERPLYQK